MRPASGSTAQEMVRPIQKLIIAMSNVKETIYTPLYDDLTDHFKKIFHEVKRVTESESYNNRADNRTVWDSCIQRSDCHKVLQ